MALRWEHSLHIMSLDGAVNPLHPVSYDFFKKVFFFFKKKLFPPTLKITELFKSEKF